MNFPSEENRMLIALLEKRKFTKAHIMLNRMEPAQLEGETASLCLTAALYGTVGLFQKVLNRCLPGEHGGSLALQPTPDIRAYVSGTLLTLAAALNRPEHVKILLAAGYDPNSAGVESAAAFYHGPFITSNTSASRRTYCAVPGNRIHLTGKATWSLECATPLAAAIACGSREAATVLLRHPNVWKSESSAVCRAAVSAFQIFRKDARQELAGLPFGKSRQKVFDPHILIRTCDLHAEYTADFCAYDLLDAQISNGFFDETDARTALKCFENSALFNRSGVRARIRKMNLLAEKFPEVCREPWATGLFLRELVHRSAKEEPHKKLLRQWKKLSGEEGDLTWAQVELYRMPRKNLQQLLNELKQELPLVMDADALASFGKEAKGELMDILSHVELRHNTGLDGISGLAMALLRIGELRYLRKAASLGVFAEEDPQALLEHLRQQGRNDLRAMMLTCGGRGQKTTIPRWKEECRERQWSRYWNISPAAYNKWLVALMEEELPREECLRRLQMMRYGCPASEFWQPECTISVQLPETSQRTEICVRDPEAALFCGSQTQPLQLMAQYMPEKLRRRYFVDFSDHSLLNLEGTPLALAAATGRTELVRFWLNQGVDPDETGYGATSFLQWFHNNTIPLTPVMAAIYYGEEETARLLLEAGAVCDFFKPMFRKLLERGNARTLAVAEKLPGTNFQSIPEEWLTTLKGTHVF